MLKQVVVAASILISMHSVAQAGEATELCGQKITWRRIKCTLALGSANGTLDRAQRYESYAKHAEVDNDLDRAQKWRNRAEFNKAEGKRLKEKVYRKYGKKN